MDSVSHLIMGGVTVTALNGARSRFGRGALAASMLGSIAPDIDALLMPRWDVYLRWHEVATHALVGGLLTGAAAGWLCACWVRSGYGRLAAAGSVGAMTHLALDAGSGARLALLWPLSEARFPLPLFAMADPSLIVALSIGVIVVWASRASRPRAAAAVLAGVALLYCVKGVAYAKARQTVAAFTHQPLAGQMFDAQWGTWHQWYVYDSDASAVRSWRVDGRQGTMTLLLEQRRQAETPLVTASRALPTVVNLQRIHAFTFAIESVASNGERLVRWSDVRFCWRPAGADRPIECGLWFGGAFDVDGQPIRQVMQVGGWTQTRLPAE